MRRLMDWQQTWIGAGQHGFRRNHGTLNVYWKLALQVEKALLSGEDDDQLWGFTVDFA